MGSTPAGVPGRPEARELAEPGSLRNGGVERIREGVKPWSLTKTSIWTGTSKNASEGMVEKRDRNDL